VVDVLWKPWKLLLPVGGAVVVTMGCLFMLFVLIVYFTILNLPFGREEAMAWFLNRPYGVVVQDGQGQPSDGPLPPSAYRLDTGQVTDWFGGYVTSEFRDPARPHHSGVDIGLPTGTPIPTTMEGTVVFAGWSPVGYGNLVVVENGPWRTYYAHLSVVGVQVGQKVQRGETVGLSGSTGNSTGPHLHYEVRYDNVPIRPTTHPGGQEGGK